MDFVIGEVFNHNGARWTITSVVYTKNGKVRSFSALTFTGSYYMINEFEVNQQLTNEAA